MPGPSNPTIVAGATTEELTRQKLKKFSWEEIHKHRSRKDCWIVVKGKVYDVSSWVEKHPGGDIILNAGGREATGMFLSYHPLYVSNKLPQFLIGEVADYHPYYDWDQSEFYTVLKQRVEKYMKENKLGGDPIGIYLQTLCVIIGWFATYYYGLIQGSMLGAFLFGIFHSHLGISISHDGCHGSYSKNKTITRLASYTMDLMGGSRLVWYMQHNIGHHPNCNRQGTTSQAEDYDPDVRSGNPIMRFNDSQPWLPYHRFQHLYIWLLFPGVGIKWYINDVKAVWREKYLTFDFFEITELDRKLLLTTKLLFVVYSVIVPLYLHGIVRGLSLMLLFWSVTSYMFALNFAVNHLTEDNHFPKENNQPVRDWAKLQVITSSNFGTSNPICTWITGGLNYQIEHHLFPGINHVYLAQIAPIVKQTCKEYGLKYTDYPSYSDALIAYYRHVKNLGTAPVPHKKVL